jgi:hypothetical protein
MLQSSLPTFCFSTPVLQTGSRIASQGKFETNSKTELGAIFEFRISSFRMVAGTGVAPVEAEFMRLA